MIPDWYLSWVEFHRTSFLLRLEWVDAAITWWEDFDRIGATEIDLRAATNALKGDVKLRPQYPGDHLPAVYDGIGNLRLKRAADEREILRRSWGEQVGICCDCQDSGCIVVPHQSNVIRGKWEPVRYRGGRPVYVTMAVACRCPRGRRVAESCGQMGIEWYQANILPDWRVRLQEVEEEDQRFRERHVREGFDLSELVEEVGSRF